MNFRKIERSNMKFKSFPFSGDRKTVRHFAYFPEIMDNLDRIWLEFYYEDMVCSGVGIFGAIWNVVKTYQK